MANILPVSDLRNYNEVLKNCRKGEPVYLTKNGRGRFVVLDIEDYERDRAEEKLLTLVPEHLWFYIIQPYAVWWQGIAP